MRKNSEENTASANDDNPARRRYLPYGSAPGASVFTLQTDCPNLVQLFTDFFTKENKKLGNFGQLSAT
jgi:hypothetical protein